MNVSYATGSLLAVFFLVGRWSFARLEDGADTKDVLQQPRFWLILGILALGTLAYGLRRQRRLQILPTSFDTALVCFLSYALLAALWAPDRELAAIKAYEIGLMLAAVLVIVLNRSSFNTPALRDGFWTTLISLCLAMGVVALMTTVSGRVQTPTGGPNTFGRNMGLLGVGAFYVASKRGPFSQFYTTAIVALSLLLVLTSGSRGALLAATVAGGVFVIFARARLSTKVLALGAMAVAVLGVMFFTTAGSNALEVFRSRVIEQTVHDRHLSGRDEIWMDAWTLALEKRWCGWGLSGFRTHSWTYPHNLFLEVFVETGLVGLVLLLNMMWQWWSYLRRVRFSLPRENIAAVALVLTSCQTSGDLFDSRGVFLTMALAAPPLLAFKKATARCTQEPCTKPAQIRSWQTRKQNRQAA